MTAAGGAEQSWYSEVSGSELYQGDIFHDYPVAVVQSVRNADAQPNVFIESRDVVVLTQTCDIPKLAQTSILLAQITSYRQYCQTSAGTEVSSEKYRRKLAENVILPFFLLREAVGDVAMPWSLVSFRDLYVTPKDEILLFAAACGVRLRMESPYREHLSQSFGRFMMRVGLPNTTHDFVKFAP